MKCYFLDFMTFSTIILLLFNTDIHKDLHAFLNSMGNSFTPKFDNFIFNASVLSHNVVGSF